MKKILTLTAMLVVSTLWTQSTQAQSRENTDFDISELVDRSSYYGLSRDQKERLIARKRSIGREFAAIGRDRSLSGREKGMRKRELSMQIQRDIHAILDENQYSQYTSAYDDKRYYSDRKDAVNDRIDDEIDRLEDRYEADIKLIERTYKYDKYTLKREKNKRKEIYKSQKQMLKSQKL